MINFVHKISDGKTISFGVKQIISLLKKYDFWIENHTVSRVRTKLHERMKSLSR